MSKKLFLLFVISLMISCEGIQYDGETRLVFQTTVLNANGQPLPNSHVEINVDYSLISEGTTDQNGKITLIFPAPKSDLPINLKIYNEDESYLEKEILNIRKTDFENYKFIYQNAHLVKSDETANLMLTYNQTNFGTAVKKVGINGIYHMQQEYYNTTDEFFPLPEGILIKKNQAFQLKYTVVNLQTNAETEHVVDLTIANDPISYTINY